ncbi:AraC family transcriptional regulator [Scytonema tolypothrichoides VB-61278]|nr:AraC family transcriptional regulator [Scytonema tolypothrichoides VB-61278]
MSSPFAVHPSDTMQDEWVLSSHLTHTGGLMIEHQIQPSGECEASGGLTHHVLVFELGYVPRQVSRIGEHDYDGPLCKGDLLVIPAQAPLFGACETSDEVLSFVIEPAFLRQIALETECLDPDCIELLTTFKVRDIQLEAIAQMMQSQLQQGQCGTQLYLDSLANLLAIHLLRHYTVHCAKLRTYEGGLATAKLRQVLNYISAHIERDFTLADLADIAGISQCYFVCLFKQSMGITPWQYVTQQRVERAKTLLRQRDCLIAQIALECGFNSQSHFTQQFRKLTGVTPKQYSNGIQASNLIEPNERFIK